MILNLATAKQIFIILSLNDAIFVSNGYYPLMDFGNYHLYQLNVLNASQNIFRTQALNQTHT